MSVVIGRSAQQCSPELPRYRRADGLAWVGESRVVVIDAARPNVAPIALEGSAAWMWHRLAQATSAAALAYRAAQEFSLDVEDLIGDVQCCLDRLTANGLLECSDDTGARQVARP